MEHWNTPVTLGFHLGQRGVTCASVTSLVLGKRKRNQLFKPSQQVRLRHQLPCQPGLGVQDATPPVWPPPIRLNTGIPPASPRAPAAKVGRRPETRTILR